MAEDLIPTPDVFAPDSDDPTVDPTHFLNMVPPSVRDAALAVPSVINMLTEEELKKTLFGADPPRALEQRLRIAFWKEYEDAQERMARNRLRPGCKYPMSMRAVCTGICNPNYFTKLLEDPYKVSWITRPPVRYHIANEELLHLAQARTREILSMSLYDKRGRPLTKLIDTISRIRTDLENRVKGAILQKSSTLNVNYDANGKALPPGSAPAPDREYPKTREEFDKKIAELATELNIGFLPPAQQAAPLAQPESIDAEFVPVEAAKP